MAGEVASSNARALAAEAAAAEATAELDRRRGLLATVCVQLSDCLARSGRLDPKAPMLCDSASGQALTMVQLEASLAQLVSHVAFYWAEERADAHAVRARLRDAEAKLAERAPAKGAADRFTEWRASATSKMRSTETTSPAAERARLKGVIEVAP